MNQHKKIWFLLFILTFMFSCYSVTALATEITPDQVNQIIKQQQASSQSEKAASSRDAASSSRPAVSRRPYSSQTPEGDSSILSDGLSEDVSNDLFGSEESSEIILPSVNSVEENDPLSSLIVNPEANKKMNWIGIVSWICIVLGVAVVLIVVFSNRRPPRGGPGRKRYRRPSRTRKKRLLNDKYYRNMKY